MSAFPIEKDIERYGNKILVSGHYYNWVKKSRRIRPGQIQNFVDSNHYLYRAEFVDENKGKLVFRVIGKSRNISDKRENITWRLVLGLPAQSNLQQILHYTAQIGFDEIVLLNSEHSPFVLHKNQYQEKQERYHSILEQGKIIAERFFTPKLFFFENFDEYFAFMITEEGDLHKHLSIAAVPNLYGDIEFLEKQGEGSKEKIFEFESLNSLKNKFRKFFHSGKNKADVKNMPLYIIDIFVGPEGGFSESELDFFDQQNLLFVSIGDRVQETVNIIPSIIFYLRGLLDAWL